MFNGPSDMEITQEE